MTAVSPPSIVSDPEREIVTVPVPLFFTITNAPMVDELAAGKLIEMVLEARTIRLAVNADRKVLVVTVCMVGNVPETDPLIHVPL